MAVFTSVPTEPEVLPVGGVFTSVPVGPSIRYARIDNQSGIGLSLARLRTVPPGVTEVDGYKERFRNDASQATRVFDVPWGLRFAFVVSMLGYSTNIGGVLRRTLPQQHPEFPWLYAQECNLVQGLGAWANNPHVVLRHPRTGEIEPGADGLPIQVPMICYFDTAAGSATNVDGKARYEVLYTHVPWEYRTDAEVATMASGELERYVSREITYAMSNLPLPVRQTGYELKFAEGPPGIIRELIPDATAGVLVPMSEITLTWHDVPDIPNAVLDNSVTARVNAAEFGAARGYRGYPPQTLLCQPPRIIRQRSAVGRVTWQIVYKFIYRNMGTFADPKGWNHFPAANAGDPTGGWYLVTAGGILSGARVYKTADFSQLFRMPPVPVDYQ